jgi:S-adenosylmethionine:tRNA ribosyltransferase-isomerase
MKSETLAEYDYTLPQELIASEPVEPRDASRLLIYDTRTGQMSFDVFRSLGKYLPAETLLALNDTKVVPARLHGERSSDGKRIECLLLVNEISEPQTTIRALANAHLTQDEVVTVGSWRFVVVGQEKNVFTLRPEFPLAELGFVLEEMGETPIPPYIAGTELDEEKLRSRYQSVLAKTPASAAAPTASLHVTERLLRDLEQKGIDHTTITLHVGLGTFAPVTEKQLSLGRLHSEYYHITHETRGALCAAQENRRPICAVGTTVVRTLESVADDVCGSDGDMDGSTDLFILPPYDFKMVDALITNFHVPRSSLMALVDAFLRDRAAPHTILDLYYRAIEQRMRFYSFGDAMLII